ncbi:hypothetical protein OS493_039843 [Desmophyllum pertusum]|uniref:Gelsolin-like domain-containing protein n=1 Tax=Desmophyllum pertusum TaxID=174260 RepID=A0A9W9Z5K6_9CNID|nr:hypothetical protein OS493_039843 [Desmophyllum pertusum]
MNVRGLTVLADLAQLKQNALPRWCSCKPLTTIRSFPDLAREEHDLYPLEPNLHGVFFSGDSYVIKYSFTAHWRRQMIIYFWQGARSSIDERAASAMLADQMDKNLGGIATQVRVVQNKETRTLFENVSRAFHYS